MTIVTYAQLQTSIADYLNRSDISATTVRDFITLAESKINRSARLRDQETTTVITMTTTGAFNSLPSGFIDIIDAYYNSDDVRLVQVSADKLGAVRSGTSSGQPRYFTISNRLDYEVTPAVAYTWTLKYWKKWDLATNTVTTQLLIDHPGAYLYAALAEAEAWLKNDPRIVTWKAMANEALQEIEDMSSRPKGRAELTVDPRLLNVGYTDINNG